tara:strand:- start:371 stop:1168 length:798 start_codon:yes stop_codon:yes gene_type:complete
MKKYLVIGNPIKHSLSPKLHNYWIKLNKFNAIYEKRKLDEKNLKDIIFKIKKKKINGINVTVPFKNKIIPYLDKLSLEAEKTQSVNTICLKNDKIFGYNTDIDGFEFSLNNLKFNVKKKKVFILGSGGVVPSIIFALKKLKVLDITLSNRTRSKAENLKNLFEDLKVIDWGKVPNFDIIINATSIGLKKDDKIGIDLSEIGENKLFYDVIYNPKQTNFLKIGKKLGNKTENGMMMFIYQAYSAFKLWHGIYPKVNKKVTKLLIDD